MRPEVRKNISGMKPTILFYIYYIYLFSAIYLFIVLFKFLRIYFIAIIYLILM
jgi:hypothetical protein